MTTIVDLGDKRTNDDGAVGMWSRWNCLSTGPDGLRRSAMAQQMDDGLPMTDVDGTATTAQGSDGSLVAETIGNGDDNRSGRRRKNRRRWSNRNVVGSVYLLPNEL